MDDSLRLLFLDREAVERHLSMELCMGAVEGAFRALQRGRALQPLRTLLTLPPAGTGSPERSPSGAGRASGAGRPSGAEPPEASGVPEADPDAFLVMPGHLEEPAALGAKLLTLFPRNHDRGLPSHQGIILLFDPETGTPQAVVDAAPVTALRTAAASGVATRLLALPDASSLAILGSGVQARSHLEAMLAVRPIREVRIWSRTREHARAFEDEARATHGREGIRVHLTAEPEEAIRGAEVICTVTASPRPILEGGWLAPGAHVNAVGAYTAATRELDSEAVAQARFYVDRRESALAEAGDLLLPIREGRVGEDHIQGEIGELLEGTAEGRTSPEDRTVFKSLGLAVQDLAAAAALLRKVSEATSNPG